MDSTEILPTVLVKNATAVRAPPGVFDLLVRGQQQLTELLVREADQPGAILSMLAVAIAGMAVHALVLGVGAELVPAQEGFLWQRGFPALWMPFAFVAAFLGALVICLPTFYFHTLLAGLDAPFRLVVAQALRAQATTSALLLGIAPFYAAYLLSLAVGVYRDVEGAIMVGLALPFAVGLFGVRAVYHSFQDLIQHVPITHPRRGNYLGRMVLLWGGLYTTVAPVALWRIAQVLTGSP